MKKILVSLGLILTLVLCCAFVPVNAAEECKHEELTFQFFLESQEKPENCLESGIAKYTCDDCGAAVYLKETGAHKIAYEFTELSCTEDQKVIEKCTLCKKTISESVVTKALEHNYVEKAVAAECDRPAGVAEICTNCGEEKEGTFKANDGSEAVGHDWKETEKVAATCKKDGYTLETCSKCKETRKTNVVAKGPEHHVKVLVSVLKNPTCTANGIGKYKCQLCDAAEWYEAMAPEHTWDFDNMVIIKKVTCGQDGLAKVKCKLCDAKNDEFVIENTGLEHQWKDVVLSEDCTNPARVGKICSVCGEEDLEKVAGTAAKGHDFDETPCDAICGREAGVEKVCKVCGYETFVAYPKGNELYQAALEHDTEAIADVAATCTKKGSTGGEKCKVCGEITVKPTEVPVNKNNHVNLDLVTTLKAPGCVGSGKLGVGKYECADCGKDLGYQSINETCQWVLTKTTTKATCTKVGKGTYTCSVCKATKTDDIPKAAHTYVEKSYAICGETAKVVDECKVCKQQVIKSEGALVEHTYGEITTYEATCIFGEFVGRVCSNPQCKDNVEVIELLSAPLGHDCVETFYEESCTKANGVYRECQRCDFTQDYQFTAADGEVYRPKLGHKLGEDEKEGDIIIKGYAATCVAKGLSDGRKCSRCATIVKKQTATSIDKTAHKLDVIAELKAATCTTDGIGKYGCTLCGKAEEYYGIIEAGHDKELVVVEAPTCGKDGKGYYVCKVEGCEFKSKEEKIPATGEHDYKQGIKEATCDTPDQIGQICTVCGDAKDLKTVAGSTKLGHDLVEKYFAATCGKANGVTSACTRCNYKAEKVFTEADGEMYEEALEHVYVAMKEVAATCTKKGSTGGTVCKLCGETGTKPTELPIVPTNHNFSKLIATLKAPNCEYSGVGKYQCSYCGKAEQYKVMPIKHETIDVIVKHATCGEAGEKYQLCTLCGWESDPIEIKATKKHTMVADYVIEATCDSPAVAGLICSVCNYYESKNVVTVGEKLAHDYKETTCEATCGRAAGVLKVCKACKHEEFVEYTGDLASPALEHDYKQVTVESTCKVVGYTAEVCKNCGGIKEGSKVVDPNGVNPNNHKPVADQIIKAPTCTTTGVAKAKCSDCGKDAGYIAVKAECKYGEVTANESGTLVYVECVVCKGIKVVQYFGPEAAGIKAGDKFASLKKYEEKVAEYTEAE